jgi:histidinol-phosphate phosphatase family protein
MAKIKYLFVDFDGTVRETIAAPTQKNPNDRRPPITVDEVQVIPGISERLQEWRDKGWFIVGVSNQSGVEKGYITAEGVEKVAAATMDKLGMYFPFHYAPCKKDGTLEQLSLRKPETGMAEEAFKDWGEPDLENSFMVGDYVTDEQFAENLGIKYIDVWDFVLGEKDNE